MHNLHGQLQRQLQTQQARADFEPRDAFDRAGSQRNRLAVAHLEDELRELRTVCAPEYMFEQASPGLLVPLTLPAYSLGPLS